MENKINIAKILNDCKEGTKLYSPIFGDVYFKQVKDTGYETMIIVTTSYNTECAFYDDGKLNTHYSESEITLFPDKYQRDWTKFKPSNPKSANKHKFKVGDNIAHKSGISNTITITKVSPTFYYTKDNFSSNTGVILVSNQDEYVLVEGKFDINLFKPFMKVLVRNYNRELWKATFFNNYEKGSKQPFICITGSYEQCVPYEGNEKLFNTNNKCDERFKLW